jgi:general secretion pathway protein L
LPAYNAANFVFHVSMSTLVIQIPARTRLRASSTAPGAPENHGPTQYLYAISPDGVLLATHGCCAASLLPKATSVVAVLGDEDVSWHRIDLPKAPAARLQSALVGVLEEALLEDADLVHLAVEPQATAGEPSWIAACERAWLAAALAELEKAQVFVDRVVPMSWPDEPARGHFSAQGDQPAAAGKPGTLLNWAHPDGVALLTLQGGLARSVVTKPAPGSAHWSATPHAVEAAEAWLGFPVTVMAWPQRALQATRSLWNLRQFSLARKNRGTSLALVTTLGLNLWAVQQRSAISARKAQMAVLLQTAHPQERSVLDAAVQMQRATDALKTAAGKPTDTDFEPMLQVAASQWPTERPPVDNLRFEGGKLTLAAVGWTPEQITQFGNQLRPSGWQVDSVDGRLVMSRLSALRSPQP